MKRRAAKMLVLGAILAAAAATSASAQATYPSRLRGMAADFAYLEIAIVNSAVVAFAIDTPLRDVPGQCVGSSGGFAVPIVNGGFAGPVTSLNPQTGGETNIFYRATIDANGLALGNMSASAGYLNPCTRRNVAFAAVPDPGEAPPTPGALFVGTTDRGGSLTFRTTAAGTLTALDIVMPAGCPPIRSTLGLEFPIVRNAVAIGSAEAGGALRLFISGDRAAGVLASWDPPPSGCFPVLATFSARAQAPAVSPTPPPSVPGGATVVGAIPGRGTIGLLVAATAAPVADLLTELASKGCAPTSVAVLRAGSWSVYVSGAPAAVNAAFPSPLAAATPFFVACG